MKRSDSMHAQLRRRVVCAGAGSVLLAVLVSIGLAACGSSPTAPDVRHDLTGRWRGFAQIPTTALATPLEMSLTDTGGQITGTGGGVDCRYFLTCGSFYSYVVRGGHESTIVTLTGETPEGRRWTLNGRIGSRGLTMSGTISSADFPTSPWQMEKQP